MDDLELALCCYFAQDHTGVQIKRKTTTGRGKFYYLFDDGSKLALQKNLIASDSYLWTDGQTGATIKITKKLGRNVWVLSDGVQISKDFRIFGGNPTWTISGNDIDPITISKKTAGKKIGFISSLNILLTKRGNHWETEETSTYHETQWRLLLGGTVLALLAAGYGYYRVKKWWRGDGQSKS